MQSVRGDTSLSEPAAAGGAETTFHLGRGAALAGRRLRQGCALGCGQHRGDV